MPCAGSPKRGSAAFEPAARIALAAASVLGQLARIAIGLLLLAGIALTIWLAWTGWTPPPSTQERIAAEQVARQQRERARQEAEDLKLDLCRTAAACKKYSAARLECATAGNFRTCLRIKMGEDAYYYSAMCSGGEEGAPAFPLPPQTPNAVDCFFRTLLK
jgi:hypothetical protein